MLLAGKSQCKQPDVTVLLSRLLCLGTLGNLPGGTSDKSSVKNNRQIQEEMSDKFRKNWCSSCKTLREYCEVRPVCGFRFAAAASRCPQADADPSSTR
jgi:hypothetical protein